jgi:hypothetical protein
MEYKEKFKNNPVYKQKIEEKKIVEIITIENDVFTMSLMQFISSVQQNHYNEHVFYDKWKIIR